MQHRSALLLAVLWLVWPTTEGRAQSTIDSSLAYGWSANTGWTNWRASVASGAAIGEFVCRGSVYAANVGWISLGSGAPANGIQYQNNSPGDYGVNYFATNTPGVAILRGYAYGANIGWINFEAQGNPSVNLINGQLYGYAYSANCGWINLGTNTTRVVRTDSIAPGVDTDGDGIADAWELLHFGNLSTATSTSDANRDGVSDLQAYLAGTSPLSGSGALRITGVSKTNSVGPVALSLAFTSTPARLYLIETSPTLINPTWTDSGLGTFLPDAGTTTIRQVNGAGAAAFFRVRALRLGL